MHYQKLFSQITFFGILAISLVGCTLSNPLWTLFTEERAEQIGIGSWVASDTEFGGYWTPTQEDIQTLEGKLDSFLREHAESFRRQPPAWEQLDDYQRQYVGVIINDKRAIYGNFFCTETGVDWRKEWVLVMDGGDCFFQLQFDVESGTFTELMVNGEA